MTPLIRISVRLLAVFITVVSLFATQGFAQTTEEKVTAVEGKVEGTADRVTELENTVNGMAKLKISGYVQPQWQWQDIDSLGNQTNSRNAFTIRRGRVKFVHKTADIGATIQPDITENGLAI